LHGFSGRDQAILIIVHQADERQAASTSGTPIFAAGAVHHSNSAAPSASAAPAVRILEEFVGELIEIVDALHSGGDNDEVELIAPSTRRSAQPAPPCASPTCSAYLHAGLTALVSDFEQGEIGTDLSRKGCELSLKSLVSKRADWPYRGGRSNDLIKVKNRQHPP